MELDSTAGMEEMEEDKSNIKHSLENDLEIGVTPNMYVKPYQ